MENAGALCLSMLFLFFNRFYITDMQGNFPLRRLMRTSTPFQEES